MEEDKVYFAVGKDVNESMLALSWALRNFGGDNFCILRVHPLPQTIASCKPKKISFFIYIYIFNF
jgi:hypothetical protein